MLFLQLEVCFQFDVEVGAFVLSRFKEFGHFVQVILLAFVRFLLALVTGSSLAGSEVVVTGWLRRLGGDWLGSAMR